jgi:hypothetical protein
MYLKYFELRVYYVNYVKFSFLLAAPEEGQLRPKYVGLYDLIIKEIRHT